MHDEQRNMTAGDASGSQGLLDFALLIAREKLFIIGMSLLFGVVCLGLSFVWPNTYTATVRLVTPRDTPSGLNLTLAEVPGLASLAGLSSGSLTSEQYIVFLKSRTVYDAVIDRFDLMTAFDVTSREKAYARFDTLLSVTPLENTNVLEVKVRYQDPETAAEIANYLLDQLKAVLIDIKNQATEAELAFLKERLRKAETDLMAAEEKLAEFQEETGFVQLDYQSRAIIETIAELNAALAEKNVQLSSLLTYQTENSSEVRILKNQIAELEKQIRTLGQSGKVSSGKDEKALSEAAMQFTEYMRDYKIREALVNAVRKEFEMVSLEEARTEASVQVLDPAVPPEEKTSPKRALVLLLGLVIGALIAVTYLYLRDRYRKASADSQEKVSMIKQEMFRLR